MRHILQVVVLITLPALTAATIVDTPQQISARVKALGAKAVVSEIYAHPDRWNSVLSGISSGSRAWLDVARVLISGADGDSSEQLSEAAGNTLEKNAAAALEILWSDYGLGMCRFMPDTSNPKYSTKSKAMEGLESRVQYLRRVTAPKLKEARDACVAELLTWKTEIEQMYRK